MYKVKTEWYFSQSKSHLALPNQEREVWAMVQSYIELVNLLQVLDNKLDDLLPKLSLEVKKKLDDFINKLFQEAGKIGQKFADEVKDIRDKNPNLSKKDFVSIAKTQFPDFAFGIASKIFDGKDSTKAAMEVMKGQCTSKGFEAMRTLFGLSELNFFKHSLSFSERD